MQEIIILILFTYPGAMADYFHSLMASGKQWDNTPDEHFRIARDFFLSAMITLASMAVFCMIRKAEFSLTGVTEALQEGKGLWIYAAISFLIALLTAAAWSAGNRGFLKASNRCRASRGTATIDETKRVWESMMNDPEIPFNKCVMAIYQGNQLIKAGIPHNVSNDVKSDPWAILTWTETAMQDLQRPADERSLLINPDYSFVNLENSMTVDIYEGTKFRDFISAWVAEQAPEN